MKPTLKNGATDPRTPPVTAGVSGGTAGVAAELLSGVRGPALRVMRPVILFVLGMGRSGTSALTRVLSLCGAALPGALLGPNEGNPLGHWEPQTAIDLNDAILAQHGATWYDPTLRLQGEIPITEEHRATHLQRIGAFLRTLPTAPLLVIKEPRITALSGLWFEAASQAGFFTAVAIPVRHPNEVAASLAARDRMSPQLATALWLKYNLLAERQSRTVPRAFVEYPSLLRDWRAELARIATALSIDLSIRDETVIDDFLRQDLRRQQQEGGIAERFAAQWVSQVYAALSAAARDEPLDTGFMDEVFESYRACERGFRIALEDFHAHFSGAEGIRKPNVTRLIHAVAGRDSEVLRSCLRSQWYRERNPDLTAAQVDVYEHWLAHGSNEGRLPCADPLSLLELLLRERTTRPAASAGSG
jgi:hypothetical protein